MQKKLGPTQAQKVEPVPHSWRVNDWPAHVFPGRASTGRYIVRRHRETLERLGALSRIGREIVVFGTGYARFLAKGMDRVRPFEFGDTIEETDSRTEAGTATDAS